MLPELVDIRLVYLVYSVLFLINAFTTDQAEPIPFYIFTQGDLAKLIWQHPKYLQIHVGSACLNLAFMIGIGILAIGLVAVRTAVLEGRVMVRLEAKIMGINPFWISALLTAAFLIVCATGGDNVNWGYLGFEVLFPFYMAVAVGEWCRIRADQIFDVISAQGKSLFLWIVRRFLVLFVTVTVFAVIGMFGTVIITKTRLPLENCL